MKRSFLFLPAAAIIAVAGFWLVRQASEGAALRTEMASLRAAKTERTEPRVDPKAMHDLAEMRRQIAELQETLRREEADVQEAEKSLAEIRRKLPLVEDGETVVSFGRITDMGREAAVAIRGALMLVQSGSGESPGKEAVQASFMKLMAWMPEIAGFEENPGEIACFQAAVFRELFELDDARARQVEETIKIHFTALRNAGLTAAQATQPNWQERRSAILTPLLWQLRPFMPPQFESPSVITQIVNAGAGVETRTETHFSKENGKSSHTVSMSLPSWPRLPWLPTKEKR